MNTPHSPVRQRPGYGARMKEDKLNCDSCGKDILIAADSHTMDLKTKEGKDAVFCHRCFGIGSWIYKEKV